MRYVMVWFTCSVKDCEAKAEGLVEARIDRENRIMMTRHDREYTKAQLPEGWSSACRIKQNPSGALRDRERTYCPEHAWDGGASGT